MTRYRIGVDVGGTNTDAVVMADRSVLAAVKAPTTRDVTSGVLEALVGVLEKSGISRDAVAAVSSARRISRTPSSSAAICRLLDLDTGHAITAEVLRYGQRVAVVGLPCHPLLQSEAALKVIGPKALASTTWSFDHLPVEIRITATTPVADERRHALCIF